MMPTASHLESKMGRSRRPVSLKAFQFRSTSGSTSQLLCLWTVRRSESKELRRVFRPIRFKHCQGLAS